MKIEIRVDTDEYADIEWPEGLPLPNAGDDVLIQLKTGATMFTVDSRFFSIGTSIDGKPLAQVRIQGRAAPAKS